MYRYLRRHSALFLSSIYGGLAVCGITLGILLGTSLGIDDGDLLGWLDGFWLVEGIDDGDLLGWLDGFNEGTSLGIDDGDLLG